MIKGNNPVKNMKEVEIEKINVELINTLLEELIVFNEIKNDFLKISEIWNQDLDLLINLEDCSRNLIEKAVKKNCYNSKVTVAVVGDVSSGKSTFINSLIQENICPEADKSLTSSSTTFSFAHDVSYYIVENEPNKRKISREDYQTMIQHGTDKTVRGNAHFFVEGPWDFVRDFALIDTPGFERGSDTFIDHNTAGDNFLSEKTIIEDADVVFWLMDINTGTISNSQKERIKRLKGDTNNKVEFYFVLNRSDEKPSINGRQNIVKDLEKDIGHFVKKIFQYSSKSPFQDILIKLNDGVNKQCVNKEKKWELKISSSIGRRGGVKFHYYENEVEITFSHKPENSLEYNGIYNRLEVLKLLRKFKEKKKDLFNSNFENEVIFYKKKKEELKYFKNEVDKQLVSMKLNSDNLLKQLSEDLDSISNDFVQNNFESILEMEEEKDKSNIVHEIIRMYTNTFRISNYQINSNYELRELREFLKKFNLQDILLTHFKSTNNIGLSVSLMMVFIETHLKFYFNDDILNKDAVLKTKLSNISNNLAKLF